MGTKFSDKYIQTIGLENGVKKIDSENIKFFIWDTSGEERCSDLAPLYIKGAAVVLIAFDPADRASFDAINYYHGLIENVKNEVKSKIILVATKADLIEDLKVSKEEAQAKAAELGADYIETSAKNGVGIDALNKILIASKPKVEVAANIENSTRIDVTKSSFNFKKYLPNVLLGLGIMASAAVIAFTWPISTAMPFVYAVLPLLLGISLKITGDKYLTSLNHESADDAPSEDQVGLSQNAGYHRRGIVGEEVSAVNPAGETGTPVSNLTTRPKK
jgi:small GTP-binding protein